MVDLILRCEQSEPQRTRETEPLKPGCGVRKHAHDRRADNGQSAHSGNRDNHGNDRIFHRRTARLIFGKAIQKAGYSRSRSSAANGMSATGIG